MGRRWLSVGGAAVSLVLSASPANALTPEANPETPGLTPASTQVQPVPEDLLRLTPGGLTAEQVGTRAMETSFAAKQSLETMRAAQARVGAAWAAFLPRLSGLGKYTRLSEIYPPAVSFGPGVSVPGSAFVPPIWDNWLFQGTLTVPLSDYLLRINQNYTAATHSADAAKFDLGAARAAALTNGKVAYYSWLQARGSIIVAVETLNDQRVHLADARNQFTVGNASKADVMRAETSVAQAELALVTAQNGAELAEVQMRVALHLQNPSQPLVPGEGLDAPSALFQGNLQALVDEGVVARYEVKSALANAQAARGTSAANKASRYPALTAFADGVEANPNPRFFPPEQAFNATWDLGVQATWAPNDILTANSAANDYASRAAAFDAQAQLARENIVVEVTQDFEQMKQAEFAIESTRRALASATEAYRVARELFNNGRGTSTTLTDAERDLFSARIDALNASVNVRLARVRLEHAVGRDLASAAAN